MEFLKATFLGAIARGKLRVTKGKGKNLALFFFIGSEINKTVMGCALDLMCLRGGSWSQYPFLTLGWEAKQSLGLAERTV